MEVDKQLKFKSHKRMQVELISNNVDVMTHDCFSSLALALHTLMRLLAAEPRCQYLCETVLVTLCSIVWDWRVSRAGPMPFYWPSC